MTHRIVLASHSPHLENFFPDGVDVKFENAEFQVINTQGLKGEAWLERLQKEKPTILITTWGTPALPEQLLEQEHSLQYLCHAAGSVRSVVSRKFLEKGLVVSNWGSSISYTVAEHAILHVLTALRQASGWNTYTQNSWGKGKAPKEVFRTRSLRGKRVGIHGFGSIVRELVPMLKAFQANITVYSEGVPREFIESHGVTYCASLEELFRDSEVLIELEALTESSEGSVNESILQLLPEGAVFVNVGRGRVVDQDALAYWAAKKNWRIGLDVYAQEPLPADSPLHELPFSTLSPHIGGPTSDAIKGCGELALANVKRFIQGEALEGQVTLEIYDRAT